MSWSSFASSIAMVGSPLWWKGATPSADAPASVLHRRCKVAARPMNERDGMTTTTTTTTTTAVDRLLIAVTTPGTSTSDIYADDAVFDATVPGWRYAVRGSQAIGYQLAEWYYYEGALEELIRHPT